MNKKETINDRVRKVRKALDMTQQEFAEKMELKSGNTFSMIERKESNVTDQNIYLICTPNKIKEGKTVNKDWLCTGKGEMFITPPPTDGLPRLFENGKELPADEEELIGVYRDLLPGNKQYVQNNAKMILESQENTKGDLGVKEKGEKDRRADTVKKPT